MKLSYKLMITLLTIVTISAILPDEDLVANQTNKLYNALPTAVKNSGKIVTLKMSSCPQPCTVQIMYSYEIAGNPTHSAGLIQTLQFKSSKLTQTINILPPVNPDNAQIMIKIMPQTSWELQVKAMELHENNATPAQNAEAFKLMRESSRGPVSSINKKYAAIKANETITLPYPHAITSKTNSPKNINLKQNNTLQKIQENAFGVTYEKFKLFLEKEEGKTVSITMSPITETMVVGVESTVTMPDQTHQRIKQVLMITPDTYKTRVHIPLPPSTTNTLDQEITFSALPLSIFDPLKELSLTTHPLSTEDNDQKNMLTSLAFSLANSHSVKYVQIQDNQTIALPAPTKKIQAMRSALGCECENSLECKN